MGWNRRPGSIDISSSNLETGWSFVLDNMSLIESYCIKACSKGMDLEEFTQDSKMKLAIRHHGFDPKGMGGSPKRWIYLQVMSIRSNFLNNNSRRWWLDFSRRDGRSTALENVRCLGKTEHVVELALFLQTLNTSELEAVVARHFFMSDEETREEFGVGKSALYMRYSALRKQPSFKRRMLEMRGRYVFE